MSHDTQTQAVDKSWNLEQIIVIQEGRAKVSDGDEKQKVIVTYYKNKTKKSIYFSFHFSNLFIRGSASASVWGSDKAALVLL